MESRFWGGGQWRLGGTPELLRLVIREGGGEEETWESSVQRVERLSFKVFSSRPSLESPDPDLPPLLWPKYCRHDGHWLFFEQLPLCQIFAKRVQVLTGLIPSQQPQLVGSVVFPILKMRKLRPERIRSQLPSSHIAGTPAMQDGSRVCVLQHL